MCVNPLESQGSFEFVLEVSFSSPCRSVAGTPLHFSSGFFVLVLFWEYGHLGCRVASGIQFSTHFLSVCVCVWSGESAYNCHQNSSGRSCQTVQPSSKLTVEVAKNAQLLAKLTVEVVKVCINVVACGIQWLYQHTNAKHIGNETILRQKQKTLQVPSGSYPTVTFQKNESKQIQQFKFQMLVYASCSFVSALPLAN